MFSRTRIVRWLRVLLPLTALAILSTMFLFSRQPTGEPEIPYATVDAEDMAREPRIIAPEYAGVTSDGARLSLTAEEASPDSDSSPAGARALRLDWLSSDGLTAEVTAPEAGVEGETISLFGGVELQTSTGWTLSAPRLDAATDRSRLQADDGVRATAPFGEITSGRMQLGPADLSESTGEGRATVLDFADGVRLIYQP